MTTVLYKVRHHADRAPSVLRVELRTSRCGTAFTREQLVRTGSAEYHKALRSSQH